MTTGNSALLRARRMRLICISIWAVLTVCSGEISADEHIKINDYLSLRIDDKINLVLNRYGEPEDITNFGDTLEKYDKIIKDDGRLLIQYPDRNLTFNLVFDHHGGHIEIIWEAHRDTRLENCFHLGDHQWYGGPQQKHQYWPIQKLKLKEYSYISKESDNAAIAEPYWLSSSGVFIYVGKTAPLFVDQNSSMPGQVCFIAEVKAPYSKKREDNSLKLLVGYMGNAKKAHIYVVKKFLGKPSGYPDRRMIKDPVWSTWAEYKRPINESVVMEFANKILEYNFTNSQMEIDDLWEVCYGSLTVDERNFPDLKKFNLKLKEMGFRVTVWIHPFINKGCNPWYNEALEKGYLVKNEEGKTETSWWNDNGTTSTYIDFTNPEAKEWWVHRLEVLRDTYAIDSFKFDAGETSWSPQVPVQKGNIYEHPSLITMDYVRACARFGPMVEVRAGQRTQDLPIFVRMIDKDSEWDFENGLPTLVTTLLQMNMNGYPIVLPDMIGGNGYNGAPSKELFIRWLQANVFMPSLQYSYVPWDYDDEAIKISQKFTNLHINYTDHIVKAFEKAVKDGTPVNPPIWWSDPYDQTALKIWDEYMLGEDIIVAPVLEKGTVTRDVYLTKGEWLAEGSEDQVIRGPIWLKNYSAPLDTLPFFIRKH